MMLDDDFSWVDTDPFAGEGDELETTRQLASPRLYARRDTKRQLVNGLKREALNELIPVLPPPDTDVYVIGNGAGAEVRHGINPLAFDFGSFIPHIVERLGGRDCTAYISTWTMNRQHAKSMIEMLADGRLQALTVVTDPYFKRREAAIASELIMGLQQHGGRFLAFKNHVKAICISNPKDECCTVTGSANLSAQPRCEQYVLTTAIDVYQFFVNEFFEAMFDVQNNQN
jgi:hypothetical protein